MFHHHLQTTMNKGNFGEVTPSFLPPPASFIGEGRCKKNPFPSKNDVYFHQGKGFGHMMYSHPAGGRHACRPYASYDGDAIVL
jgi:hypothetical protein